MLKLSPRIVAVCFLSSWSVFAFALQPSDLAGWWELKLDKTSLACRVLLRTDKSDKGDFFLGIPAACRHAMPAIATVGRWKMTDQRTITLEEPGGSKVVDLAGAGRSFSGEVSNGLYLLQKLPDQANAHSTLSEDPLDESRSPRPPQSTLLIPTASSNIRSGHDQEAVGREDLPGRYAVMREKRDTGCMITLDKARSTGSDRAQLAPGCRDQGIVIFDPSMWQLIKGKLVLTAKAGHKTILERQGDGRWEKDLKEGGKPLGLKKL